MKNNPILYNDPKGDCPLCIIPIIVGLLLVSEPAADPSTDHSKTVQENQAINNAHNDAAVQVGASLMSGGAKTAVQAYRMIKDAFEDQPASNKNETKTETGTKVETNEHGNKLNDKPAEGHTLRDKQTGEVKKYGETTRGEDKYGAGNQKRYTKKELNEKMSNIKRKKVALKRRCTNGSMKRYLSTRIIMEQGRL